MNSMRDEKEENMRQTGKKVAIRAESSKSCFSKRDTESSKSCFSKRDTESELIASWKLKKGSKISKVEKHKSKSHVKTTKSTLIKKKFPESPSKGTGNDSGSKKSISRKLLHKKLDKISSKKLASLKLQGKSSSLVNSKGHGKVINGDAETKNQTKKKKRQKEKVEQDEASRLQRRTRYLLIKMKLEQNLIDAYSGEGWKGQSREKIKPEKELLRAKKQILKCKLGIREAIRQLDSLSSVGCIEGSVIAPDGSVHHEHDIFKEEAAFPDGGSALLNQEEDWPSDDSEDHDYNPERRENSCSISGAETDDDASSSTSLSWSSDGEAFSKSMRWEMEGNDYKQYSGDSSIGSDENSDGEIICGRRQRRTVDYKKLYAEMFGKDALAYEQVSEDEDWGPAKRRRREKESDAVNTLMTLYGSEEKCPNVKAIEVKEKLSSDAKIRRPFFRIPPNAVEKLRQVFAENELPSRTVKDNLSKELGLEREKVNKWFKNARYIALKTRKVEEGNQVHYAPKISNEPRLKDALKENVLCTPKNVKRIKQRKDSKSLSSGLKKNQHKRPLESPANSNQVCFS
ncbi:pathogenesis-related homeodomain protein-like isoform X1 [Pistacia vera]|uniref:pathogenesis-related homeodomain protein-like isoform X1 n=1 Tax=Pistacia vera TaxID=55513 RepID=UPI001263E03C|nr:pathogenesis-related homeodomain protein-like isoform X1 [Pistacia vera]